MTLLALVEQPTHMLPGDEQHAGGFSPSQLVHGDEAGEQGGEVAREKLSGGGSGEHQGSQGCS